MSIKYRCLVLDHDDTAVMSTPRIHYPSFTDALNKLRPDMQALSLEQFVLYCFNPGFSSLCDEILKLSREEKEFQHAVWRIYTEERIPDFYPGFVDFLKEYKSRGGIVTVVSHSHSDRILRDYDTHCGFTPDMVFGWEQEAHQRKPNPYPVLEIMKNFGLKEPELLVVDDLNPGLVMAKNCNVEFAGAGWAHQIQEIENYLRVHSDHYFPTVDMLREWVMG